MTSQGLSSEQARSALQNAGPNAVAAAPSRSFLVRVAAQLQSALIYLLLFALGIDVLAWLLEGGRGLPLEAIAILGVILLNAGLGVLQEYRSEHALLELSRLGAPRAWVLRDGTFQHLDAAQIVPGDVVRLEAGDRVPADGTATDLETLSVDESVLTGEALPVEKNVGEELLSGSLVAHGRCCLLVTRTGASSNMGKLAATLANIGVTKTPLEQQIDDLGKIIARVVAVLCLLMVAAGFAIEGWQHPLPILMFAVAFGVAVVPEGMPAMMTLALAFGVQRMAKRQGVVRRLASVEALGSVTVIATDKTGTLTENRLTVQELCAASGQDDNALLAMVLASDADPGSSAGDPLELALFDFARQRGAEPEALHRVYPRVSSRPFDSRWRCMRVTVVSPGGAQLAFLKGAPEAILSRCNLAEAERAQLLERVERSAAQGYKVLGLARGTATAEHDLDFVGLVSLWDPPRPEARPAVLAARKAGVRVIMVTGDHATTACAIAQSVGIDSSAVVEGSALGEGDVAVDRMLATCSVFARMEPQHKLRLIERLQAQGQVVAMTGDGLNDAPALKRADIGVAMGGRGSEVARESADLVLLDDNFATIVAAIEEGRSIYANVLSFVRFSFSSNVALLLLVLGAAMGSVFFGLRTAQGGLLLPFTALQILWINFLGDGPPALAIALDSSKDGLNRPPRPAHAPLLDATAAKFVLADGLVKGGFGLLLLVLLPHLGASMPATATAVFLYEGIAKLLSMFPARRLHGRLNPNRWVLTASALSIALQLLCVFAPPLRHLLALVELSATELLVVAVTLLTTLLAGELLSVTLRERSPDTAPHGAGA